MFFGKLLPREDNFFAMFNQHADRIVEAARSFSLLVANYNHLEQRGKYSQEVDNAERAADRVTHDVNKAIHKTFITPIDREQIHGLINTMDDIGGGRYFENCRFYFCLAFSGIFAGLADDGAGRLDFSTHSAFEGR